MRSQILPLLLAFAALPACATDAGRFGAAPQSAVVDPDTVAGDYLQGRFAASQKRYDDAAEAFARAVSGGDDTSLKASAFRYALAAGEFSNARIFAEELMNLPADPEGEEELQPIAGFLEDDLPRLVLIADHFRHQDYQRAEKSLGASFESSLGMAMGDLLEAWAVYATQGGDAGIDKIAATQDSNFAGFSPFHLALMFDLEGRNDGAEVAYGQALQAPGADMAVRSYAGFVERNKSREEALELYEKLSADRGYLRRMGRIGLARLGQPLEGETSQFARLARKAPLRVASSADEGAALVFLNFAWTAYDRAMSQREAALDAGFGDIPLNLEVPLTLAQLAVAIDDDLDAAHYIIGSISSFYERYETAAAAQARIEPQSWLYNYAAIYRAEAYVSLDRRGDAIKLIRDYLKQDALAPDVTLELANLLAQEDRIDESVAATTKAIEIANKLSSDENRSDNLWRYYFARGAVQAEAGRWEGAEPDLIKALELSPDEPGLLNYLGYSYVERGENLDEALDMIERALEARPGSGAITDSLGWAYYQMGDYAKAVELLERAVELEPGDDTITDHLGDAYWQMGRKTEARFEWRRVLEIENLDAELRATVEGKLKGEPPAAGSLADEENSQ